MTTNETTAESRQRPYSDEDLRAEATRQHRNLIEDPDYIGVGEQMMDAEVESLLPPDEADDAEGPHWGEILQDEDEFNEAQSAIHGLIRRAANTSAWAIDIGADGLEPDNERALVFQVNGKPFARVHFAFAPDLPDDARDDLVLTIGEELRDRLRNQQQA